jgi:hypothetical protein
MKVIINFEKFLEARLADLVNIKGFGQLSDELNKVKNQEFDITKDLPRSITLNNKSFLKIIWYDTVSHNLVKRLKDRTSFADVDHFIDYIKEKFSEIFPSKVGKELFKSGRYTIYLKEYNLSIIIGFNLSKNMGNSFYINIITVLPGRKGENVEGFIDIE